MVLSTSPVRPTPTTPPPPPLNVIAHIDVTEEVVEPFGVVRIEDFERAKAAAGNGINIEAQVYRTGNGPVGKAAKGAAILGGSIAAPIGLGLLIGGPVGLVAGLAVAGGLYLTGLPQHGLGKIVSAAYHRQMLPDPDWSGHRTYVISPDQGPGVDSQVMADQPDEMKVQMPDFQRFLADSMRKYPSSKTVLFMTGHGLGYRQVAGMTATGLADSLRYAEQQTGKKPDLMVLESCLMSNIEALCEIRDRMQVAVVSEEVLPVMALPVDKLLTDAAQNGGSAADMGKRMVELIKNEGDGVPTMAAIDLTRIEALRQSMDQVGQSLLKDIQNGHLDDIKAAAAHAQRFPVGLSQMVNRAMIKFGDLGQFLQALADKHLSPATDAAVAKALNHLHGAVLGSTTHDKYDEVSHISFQCGGGGFLDNSPEMQSWANADLPTAWKEVMDQL